MGVIQNNMTFRRIDAPSSDGCGTTREFGTPHLNQNWNDNKAAVGAQRAYVCCIVVLVCDFDG